MSISTIRERIKRIERLLDALPEDNVWRSVEDMARLSAIPVHLLRPILPYLVATGQLVKKSPLSWNGMFYINKQWFQKV